MNQKLKPLTIDQLDRLEELGEGWEAATLQPKTLAEEYGVVAWWPGSNHGEARGLDEPDKPLIIQRD